MRNEKLKGLMIFGSLLTVIGLILIFFSANFGTALAESWLVTQGDYADSSIYELKMQANTNNFLVAGGILFGIGLATSVFTYYKMLHIEE